MKSWFFLMKFRQFWLQLLSFICRYLLYKLILTNIFIANVVIGMDHFQGGKSWGFIGGKHDLDWRIDSVHQGQSMDFLYQKAWIILPPSSSKNQGATLSLGSFLLSLCASLIAHIIYQSILTIFEMSLDKRQQAIEQLSFSDSSLPLYSPVITKEDHQIVDFFTASNRFMVQGANEHKEDTKSQEPIYKSLQEIILPYKSSKSSGQHDSNEIESFISKQEKNGREGELLGSLPVMTREKISQAEGAFEVPELTAESLISSEEMQMDNEYNANDLLLSSIARYKIEKVFQEHSEGSEELIENEGKVACFHIKKDYAQSKGSDRSQSDDLPNVCNPCFSLQEKCKILESENGDLLKQNILLREEMIKIQESVKQRQLREREEEHSRLEAMAPLAVKRQFLQKLQQVCRILQKVNQLVREYSIDFYVEDCQFLIKFSQQYRRIDENVLNRDAKEERRLQIEQIHNNYKKIITNIIKNTEEKQARREMDFKKFINLLIKKQQDSIQNRMNTDAKAERSRKKSKTYTEKDDSYQYQFVQQNRVIEQNRLKIEWLEVNYYREKENSKGLQSHLKEMQEKYKAHLSELTRQKNTYKSQATKYAHQFSQIMGKIVKAQSICLIQSQFFKNLSQRIFQISNCVPFEDNDEQNLFAPQTQDELFDMIERIRRFYMKIEAYNLSRDNQYQCEKTSFALLLRKLVEENKISSKYLIEQILSNDEFKKLGYLKELIQSSRRYNKNMTLQRQSTKNRIMKIERTKSFTFQSLCGPEEQDSI